MPTLYLELYAGKIPQAFDALPGADLYQEGAGVYWAVLTTTPDAGSAAADYIAPVPADPPVDGNTHGTDTLPPGVALTGLTAACIWRPKTPPYTFRVQAPDGTEFTLDPPPSSGDQAAWHCLTPDVDVLAGIWTINVTTMQGTELPTTIAGRNAQLNQDLLVFSDAQFYRQPLLRLDLAFGQPPACVDVESLAATGCAPGNVQFALGVDQPGELEAITWDYGDGSPPQTFPDPVTGTTLADGLSPSHAYAAAGSYAVSVSVLRHPGCTPQALPGSVIVEPCAGDACAGLVSVERVSGCAPGTVTLRVQVGNPELAYLLSWTYGDGETDYFDADQLTAGQGLEVTHAYDEPGPITATVLLIRAVGCDPLQQDLPIEVPACAAGCAELRELGKRGCAPGQVAFNADIDDPAGLREIRYDFGDGSEQVFDEAAIAGGDGLQTPHAYAGNGPYTATVVVVRPDGCEPLSQDASVVVERCEEACTAIRSFDARGCAPGTVALRLELDDADAVEEIGWDLGDGTQLSFDAGQVAAGGGLEVVHDYDDCPYTVTVTVVRAASCEPRAIRHSANVPCCCADDVGIVVSRNGGVIDPNACVQPGNFTVTATGPGLNDVDLQWRRDGNPMGNGSEAGFSFSPSGIGSNCGGTPSTTVTLEVVPRNRECPPLQRSVTLSACRSVVVERCIPCWLLKMGMLLSLGLFAVMLAIFMCPAVMTIPPWIPLPPQVVAVWTAIAAAVVLVAPYVALLAALAGVVLLGFWTYLCRPTWCADWLVLIWQSLTITGIVFVYFALCPACLWLGLIGLPLFLLGVTAFFWWLLACRPGLCKIFYELMNLSVAQSVIGILEIVLAACIWAYGAPLMFVFVALLDLFAWAGVVTACLASRRGG